MPPTDRKPPAGMRRAQMAKRAQLVLGLMAAAALLYRMFAVWLR